MKHIKSFLTVAILTPLLLVGCANDKQETSVVTEPKPESTPKPVVEIETSMGQIVIELNQDEAPKTVNNFLTYVNSGYYTGTIFHRVIDGFMIQGGGMDASMNEKKTNDPVENEADNGLKNDTGTIAMARTSDPHSATSQFFINLNDNNNLNYSSKTKMGWGYTVFGKVTDGMDVINKIKSVKTGSYNGHQNVPKETITIISATVVK